MSYPTPKQRERMQEAKPATPPAGPASASIANPGRTARLHLNGPHGSVEVDGQDVSHATVGLRLSASVDMTPHLVLELRLDEVTMDGQAQVIVPEGTAAALVTLGWTPPGEQPPAGWLEAALRAPSCATPSRLRSAASPALTRDGLAH
ncbi:hypothetical protein [Streptomyces marianii]|uniref:Uncharacterized protein n=1 Tax=Streptomyces marianii TaxID=1817406 RepID=A0A5R9E7F0_9ACTN|nr:hypothetical protein [Streptomyces marianii]TLQ45766.1 hypothetical protein FEF34_24700 [Streptomyces marianii]